MKRPDWSIFDSFPVGSRKAVPEPAKYEKSTEKKAAESRKFVNRPDFVAEQQGFCEIKQIIGKHAILSEIYV